MQSPFRRLAQRAAELASQLGCMIIDGLFLAGWAVGLFYLNELVVQYGPDTVSNALNERLDRFVFNAVRVVFSVVTLIPILNYTIVDVSVITRRTSLTLKGDACNCPKCHYHRMHSKGDDGDT